MGSPPLLTPKKSSPSPISLGGAAVVSVETVGSVDAGVATSTGGIGGAG